MKNPTYCIRSNGTREDFRPIRIQHDLVTAAASSGAATQIEMMEIADKVLRVIRLGLVVNGADSITSARIRSLCQRHLRLSGHYGVCEIGKFC